ncbi:MAG TPA: hypothetical protein PKI77_18945, partial [Mycobacterium sp.]|nr:hypothetical protein [Mycobacterium sp.]
AGFGLACHLPNRLVEKIPIHPARDSPQQAQLPLRTGQTRFLRQPDIQLTSSQRKPPAKIHPTPNPKLITHVNRGPLREPISPSSARFRLPFGHTGLAVYP